MAALDFHIVGIGGWITNKNLVAHNVHISSTFANYITSLCPNREKKRKKLPFWSETHQRIPAGRNDRKDLARGRKETSIQLRVKPLPPSIWVVGSTLDSVKQVPLN